MTLEALLLSISSISTPKIIAIDGDAASGKTTFANRVLGANIVSMDHFYLPFNLRRNDVAGHMDFDRLISEVLLPHMNKQTIVYDCYDPHLNQIKSIHSLDYKPLLIIEGAYSCHPKIAPFLNEMIAFKIDPKLQKERILFRSSYETYLLFKNIWILKELSYQKQTDLLERVHKIVHITTMNKKPLYTVDLLKTYFPNLYEYSIHTFLDSTLLMVHQPKKDALIILGDHLGFIGVESTNRDLNYLEVELNSQTAKRLRELFDFTNPIPVLREKRSFGLGDRLGLAGVGHLEVFKSLDTFPVLAQQSMRELTLTNRTYRDVLDQASFSVFKMGYHGGFGADGDHLKNMKDIQNVLELGYTMVTLDCSDYIKNHLTDLSSLSLPQTIADVYLNKTFVFEGKKITFSVEQLKKAYYVYQDAINYTKLVYDTYFKDQKYNADFELSIDETQMPTTPEDHVFVAQQLKTLGVKIDTLAPRFCGEFQKGIDYIGSVVQFEIELAIHASIARHYGYKLSIHSGSDKFSIFEIIGAQTKGHFHLKTAGTNWLEAMRLIAIVDPKLYREIHKHALSSFDDATKLYHVTTQLNKIPNIDDLKDDQLPSLFDLDDARQLIHITYGHILSDQNELGYLFKDKLYSIWHNHHTLYASMLKKHIGRHIDLLYAGFLKE